MTSSEKAAAAIEALAADREHLKRFVEHPDFPDLLRDMMHARELIRQYADLTSRAAALVERIDGKA